MYRIESYDGKSMEFKAVTFAGHLDRSIITSMEACGDYVAVFRCNSHGNNYTGRKVYPVSELKNLTAEEKVLYGNA